MYKIKGSCLIGQSGGPTAVINSTAAGLILESLKNKNIIENTFFAANGIKGIFSENFYDMSKEDLNELKLLKNTPSSAFGSCRYKLENFHVNDKDYKIILNVFKKYNIKYFFYIGGNDSMDTCLKISDYMKICNYECRIIGVPKTIDNDLYLTDHSPGFASAAKYIITSCMELYYETNVYDTKMITIIEIMGRNTGWLTASTQLARKYNAGPDLIYLPEIIFDVDKFVVDVKKIFDKNSKCIIAVSEGIKNLKDEYISTYFSNKNTNIKDPFGHLQMGGVGNVLKQILKNKLGIEKIRVIEFNLLQRCAAHCTSKLDVDEAYILGKKAVQHAINGKNNVMIGLERTNEQKYKSKIKFFPLNLVANHEKKIPLEWMINNNEQYNDKFINYIEPLITSNNKIINKNGLPRFSILKKVKIKKI